mmetsp:Transcript_5022/g.7456  ORF Transcript_5022/g.7456 Transcript_5022/m.7456 type:complete len:107 (+) Transcript_5022:44-364(+)
MNENPDYISQHVVPRSKNLKKLRACLNCKLIKEVEKFEENGCENCKNLVTSENCHNYLTQTFDGMIGVAKSNISRNESWVARYNDIENLVTGIYAVNVYGTTQDEM